jgi:hypothetical protein
MSIVFIWRGFGLIVPIVFGICAWIVSFWYDDTRLGNASFMGWSCFYASIVLLLPGLGMWNDKDENDGTKRYHDFMFVPILIWSLGLGALCAYLLFTRDPEPVEDTLPVTQTEESTTPEEEPVYRTVNFLNSSTDSLVCVFTNDVGTERIGVGPRSWIPFEVIPGACKFEVEGPNGKSLVDFSLNKMAGPTESALDYDAAWVQLDGGEHKLIMVDVTPMMPADFKTSNLKEYDWTKQVIKEYDGKTIMEPYIPKDEIGNARVLEPGDLLPSKVNEDEQVYALITVPSDQKLTNEYLIGRFKELYFE